MGYQIDTEQNKNMYQNISQAPDAIYISLNLQIPGQINIGYTQYCSVYTYTPKIRAMTGR